MVARRIMTALVLALLVSGLFTFWLSRKLSKPSSVEAAGLRYVAAAQNLDPGTLIAAGSLKMVDWPAGAPLQGSFGKPEDIVGRTLLYPVSAGQPILDRELSAMGAGVGLSAKIPDGMRAMSLRTDEVVGVAGFLLPGTHVDVLVTYHPNGTAAAYTSIVLQDVQVLAAGQKMQPDPDGKATTANVVTLLVTPPDAEKLTLASAEGTVHFVLRNGSDRQVVNDQTPHRAAAVPAAMPAALPPTAPKIIQSPKDEKKAYVVQTLRGDKVTEEKFQ